MIVAATAAPLFDWTGWDADLVASCNARVEQLPTLHPPGQALGEVIGHPGCVLEGGTIDAFAEQLVADASAEGDVLVILGTTLIVWCVMPELVDVRTTTRCPTPRAEPFSSAARATRAACSSTGRPRCSATAPNRRSGARSRVGSVSARRARAAAGSDPARAARRPRSHARSRGGGAALESTAFATRRMIDASPVRPGASSRPAAAPRLDGWVEALADCTGLPGSRVRRSRRRRARRGVPRPARVRARDVDDRRVALGAHGAWSTRRPGWQPHVNERYARFCEVAG